MLKIFQFLCFCIQSLQNVRGLPDKFLFEKVHWGYLKCSILCRSKFLKLFGNNSQKKVTANMKANIELIRVYRLEIRSVMLVFSTQLCELLLL
jgi:hypothetical protein